MGSVVFFAEINNIHMFCLYGKHVMGNQFFGFSRKACYVGSADSITRNMLSIKTKKYTRSLHHQKKNVCICYKIKICSRRIYILRIKCNYK